MQFVLGIIGLLVGLVLAVVGDDGYALFTIVGATLMGFLIGETLSLRERLRRLELGKQPEEFKAQQVMQQQAVQQQEEQQRKAQQTSTPQVAQKKNPVAKVKQQIATSVSDSTSKEQPKHTASAAASHVQARQAGPARQVQKPNQLEKTVKALFRWLLSGNVPVKLGVLVSFFGVAFFLKYAADQGWFSAPIEVKVAGVAAFGIGLLVLGWRLRHKHRVYALSVQGGGIGILFLTVFTAFSQFNVFGPLVAFTLLFVIAVAACFLSWLQRAQALAVMGCLGGFLAPLLVSTGSGNYQVLFSYYTLLNLAVFGLAWITRWRWLNLIGFVFTFGIGAAWGVDDYTTAMFTTVEPFLIGNFLLYTGIAVLYGLSAPTNFKRVVDSTLVFGTPLVCFPMQAGLLQDQSDLALSAFCIALLYVGIAGLVYRLAQQKARLLLEAYLALAVAFATIAVPLALSAQWTAASWVLEGLALVWVGVRQQRRLPPLAGFAMLIVGAMVYSANMVPGSAQWPLLNAEFLLGLLVAASAYIAALLLWRSTPSHQRVLGAILYGWGLLWFLLVGGLQIAEFSPDAYQWAFLVCWLAVLQGANLVIAARCRCLLFATSWYGYLSLLALVALARAGFYDWPISLVGWGAWPLALIVHYCGFFLALPDKSYRSLLRGAGLWVIALLLASQVHAFIGSAFAVAVIWQVVGAMLIIALLVEVGHRLAIHYQDIKWRQIGAWPLLAFLALWLLGANLVMPATPSPLTYVPLLNPLDLTTLLCAFLVLRIFNLKDRLFKTQGINKPLAGFLAVTGLYLITCMLARVVHHWGGVPYTLEAMGESVLFQAALSITWSLAGLLGMILGARKNQRLLWFASASLMGLVVIKMFLIDLGNTDTVARIVSFIGVGVLLLVVGYFAPAPKADPRRL